MADYFNAAEYFLNLNPQAERGKKPYLICEDDQLTYGELRTRSRRIAAGLKKLGLTPEQRVMLILPDTPDFPIAFWGAMWMGAVPVPVNTMLKSPDFRYLLADSRARVLIVHRMYWEKVAPILTDLPHLAHVVMAGEPTLGTVPLAELVAEPESPQAEPTNPDEPAFWLYTSGSTGPPKGAVHLHGSMSYCAEHAAKRVLRLRQDDVTFSAAKFFFAYGLGNSLYFPLAVGCTAVVYPRRPTPEAMFEQIALHRPTVFYGVPTIYNGMLNLYDAQQNEAPGRDVPASFSRLDSLRFAVSAGEALPEPTYRRWKTLFGSDIIDGIGSTEMLHMFISNRSDDIRPGSSGKPVPGYETRIIDNSGQEVAPGEAGTLLVKGGSAAAYYWNQHKRSQATMLGEWTVTGDNYIEDEDGYFWYLGRNDDMIRVSGSWVSPVEVEASLLTHEAVAEAAVVGQQDTAGLTKCKAFVVLKPGFDPGKTLASTLMEHVKGQIASFKAPAWVEFAQDLPKTTTGKILRFTLRQ